MMIGFEKTYDWFVNVLCFLTVLFTFQFTVPSVSASPIIFKSDYHTGILETHAYDEIESSILVKGDHIGRVNWRLSKSEAGVNGEVLAGVASVAAKGGTFGEKLFLSEKFGITSEKFGSSLVKAQGSLNQPGGLFKMGWSNVAKNGGGMQMRIGIGSKVANPNQALFHMYVPKTFVPNSFANPSMQVKLSLYKLGL